MKTSLSRVRVASINLGVDDVSNNDIKISDSVIKTLRAKRKQSNSKGKNIKRRSGSQENIFTPSKSIANKQFNLPSKVGIRLSNRSENEEIKNEHFIR